MDRTRDPRRGRGALRTVLAAVKAGVLAVLLIGPATGLLHSAAPGVADAAGSRAGCAQGTTQGRPAAALIRTDGGRVRQVSFEVAWDVYEGRRPGTVLAVCVDGPSRP